KPITTCFSASGFWLAWVAFGWSSSTKTAQRFRIDEGKAPFRDNDNTVFEMVRSFRPLLIVWRATMLYSGRPRFALLTIITATAILVAMVTLEVASHAQSNAKSLPNPYRLIRNWPTLPQSMNGGKWGELIRVTIAPDGNIWVFHRCFNVLPGRRRYLRGSG